MSIHAALDLWTDSPSSRLVDVYHVRNQRKPVKLQLRDVRLKEHIDLRRGLLNGLLDRDRDPLKQLTQLELLL